MRVRNIGRIRLRILKNIVEGESFTYKEQRGKQSQLETQEELSLAHTLSPL